MARWPLLSFVFALAPLFLLAVGCRTQPSEVTPGVVTQEVTRVVSELVTVEAEPIVVTRIVEEIVEVTAAPTPQPTPVRSKALTVCMVNEPSSLYLYDSPQAGVLALARKGVWHAIYENLYTTLSFAYQAQGLEKLPDLADGDAEITTVTVRQGDLVVDASNNIVELADGIVVRDQDGQEILFDGSPLVMSQMVVRFTLRPLVWSDGVAATAADSVFSFDVAADLVTPGDKSAVDRTASYTALDDLTIEWTGLPGWLDPVYFTNVWPLLPAHQLAGYEVAELSNAPETTELPLSTGPFVVAEWVPGDHMRLVKNEHYYRATEGLPNLDSLTFLFVHNANSLMALLLAGQCDIGAQDGVDLTQTPLLAEAEANDLLQSHVQISTVFEHIDFGINPVPSYQESRPDWFEDVRVRQAMAMCTDRQRMVDEVLLGQSEVAHAYVPSIHPLYPDSITEWAYDVVAANQLLDQAGYIDQDGDGLRQDPATELPFHVTLGINLGNQMRQQVAQMFQANMADCGIEVELYPQPAADWFAPEGPLFGRRFDLAQFPWITNMTPACHLYTTAEIPTKETAWVGNNETGWSDAAFDAACRTAQASLVGTEAYRSGHQEALRIFSEQLPVIPLFSHLKLAVTRPHVQNFHLDPSQDSELWNLFEIDLLP